MFQGYGRGFLPYPAQYCFEMFFTVSCFKVRVKAFQFFPTQIIVQEIFFCREKAINPGTILFREIRPGFKSLLQIGGQFITVHSGTNVIKTLKCTGLVGGLSLDFTNPFVRLRTLIFKMFYERASLG